MTAIPHSEGIFSKITRYGAAASGAAAVLGYGASQLAKTFCPGKSLWQWASRSSTPLQKTCSFIQSAAPSIASTAAPIAVALGCAYAAYRFFNPAQEKKPTHLPAFVPLALSGAAADTSSIKLVSSGDAPKEAAAPVLPQAGHDQEEQDAQPLFHPTRGRPHLHRKSTKTQHGTATAARTPKVVSSDEDPKDAPPMQQGADEQTAQCSPSPRAIFEESRERKTESTASDGKELERGLPNDRSSLLSLCTRMSTENSQLSTELSTLEAQAAALRAQKEQLSLERSELAAQAAALKSQIAERNAASSSSSSGISIQPVIQFQSEEPRFLTMERDVHRVIPKMLQGTYGEAFQRAAQHPTGVAKAPDLFFFTPFVLLVDAIRNSASYEEFVKNGSPYLQGIPKEFTKELYENVKSADVSKLDEAVCDTNKPFDQMENDPLKQLFWLFQWKHGTTQEDLARITALRYRYTEQGNKNWLAINRMTAKELEEMIEDFLDHSRLVRRNALADPQLAKSTESDRQEYIERACAKVTGLEHLFNEELGDQSLAAEMQMIVLAAAFNGVSPKLKERLLATAALLNHSPVVCELMRSPCAEQFSESALGWALEKTAMNLQTAAVQLILQQAKAKDIPAYCVLSPRVAQIFGLSRNPRDPNAIIATLKALVSSAAFAKATRQQKVDFFDQAINWYQPVGGRDTDQKVYQF